MSKGPELYAAVERIIARPEHLIGFVEELEAEAEEARPEASDAVIFDAVARRLIEHYAQKTMISGGASAAPAMLPGLGTLVALGPGSLTDMTLCLKFEVELVLCLSSLHGFDIEDDYERSLAFLMASVETFELESGKNFFKDIVHTEAQALWNYTPRQVGKFLTTIFIKLAVLAAARGLVRAVPLVGVAVSALGNRMLTRRIGDRACEALRYRVASEG